LGLSEVFLKMAHKTPEEVVASLHFAMMGQTLTGEWDLDEEEVMQLWLVEAEGKVCGGPVGLIVMAAFVLRGHWRTWVPVGKPRAISLKSTRG
jgi:hypothetical protein